MKQKIHKIIAILLLLLTTFAGCETESYESGEGEYSLMQADLCELQTDGEKRATLFTTDDGSRYTPTKVFTAKWLTTADSTYRAIIYYNKVPTASPQAAATQTAAMQAEVLGISQVVTLIPHAHWRFPQQPQDPIDLESAWIAKSGRYLNLALLMKTARIDDDEPPHTIGLAQDTLIAWPDGRSTVIYCLLHSQNDIPEYYTNRRYVSILLPDALPDTIRFRMQTHSGRLERVFMMPKLRSKV